jgi:hypothetical protein
LQWNLRHESLARRRFYHQMVAQVLSLKLQYRAQIGKRGSSKSINLELSLEDYV